MEKIYDPKYVEELFNNMSSSYSLMNVITSFGFSERWRRKFINEIEIGEESTVIDLMTGMGECWKYILSKEKRVKKLIALDISSEMIKRAEKNRRKYEGYDIEIRKENVFDNGIEDEEADYVVSGFGMKTFNEEQLKKLAKEIDRLLIPGGKFSLIDVSEPRMRVLKIFYMFYLNKVIPILGELFLKNPESYKMLGEYTNRFKNSRGVLAIFKDHGFEVEYVEYLYGCASGIKGRKKQ